MESPKNVIEKPAPRENSVARFPFYPPVLIGANTLLPDFVPEGVEWFAPEPEGGAR